MGKDPRLMPETLHKVFMISNTLIYMLCKPLLRVLAVPYEAILPEHTQYALFQLYCDLRANPIKDRHFFEVHAKRLKPHTFPGWIALTSALLYIAAGTAGLLCMVLCMLAATLYALVFILASAGVIAGAITGLLAFSFFGLACVASFAATSAGIGYGSLASAQAVLRFLSTHLLPQPRDPFDIPELHLRPVATPRAPVSPDPAPAVNPLVIPPSPETSLSSPATPGAVSVAQVYTPDALDPIVEDAQLEAAVQEQIANAQALIEEAKENGEVAAPDAVPPVQVQSEEQSLRNIHAPAKSNGFHTVTKNSKHHPVQGKVKGISAKAGG
ncbi:hypothetical protein COCOBI_14-1960 [Coccomyxa sp. Obi]|nr:hypothetical protein COCOBI_14-1960 [Coccomyxa sp. Obi]